MLNILLKSMLWLVTWCSGQMEPVYGVVVRPIKVARARIACRVVGRDGRMGAQGLGTEAQL